MLVAGVTYGSHPSGTVEQVLHCISDSLTSSWLEVYQILKTNTVDHTVL